jgi:hypothetical protein
VESPFSAGKGGRYEEGFGEVAAEGIEEGEVVLAAGGGGVLPVDCSDGY